MVAYCIAMYSAFQQSGCRVGSMCPISTPHPNEREWEQASRYSVAQPPPTAPRRMPQQAPGPAPLPRGVRGRAAARVLRQRRRGRGAGGRDARRRRGLEWVVHAANGLRRQREAQRLGDGGAGARRGHRAQAQAPVLQLLQLRALRRDRRRLRAARQQPPLALRALATDGSARL